MQQHSNAFEHVDLRSSPPQPLPPPSIRALAFMPEEQPDPHGTVEPDAALQAWSNRLQATREAHERNRSYANVPAGRYSQDSAR